MLRTAKIVSNEIYSSLDVDTQVEKVIEGRQQVEEDDDPSGNHYQACADFNLA